MAYRVCATALFGIIGKNPLFFNDLQGLRAWVSAAIDIHFSGFSGKVPVPGVGLLHLPDRGAEDVQIMY
jgi:hypothetical protein